METVFAMDALNKVLSKRYPTNSYCIGGYQEEAVCIEHNSDGSGGWSVYNGERGNQYDKVVCDTDLEACLEFIRRMPHNTDDIAAMEEELIALLGKATDIE